MLILLVAAIKTVMIVRDDGEEVGEGVICIIVLEHAASMMRN